MFFVFFFNGSIKHEKLDIYYISLKHCYIYTFSLTYQYKC